MSRLFLIITVCALIGLTVPVVLFAQAGAKPGGAFAIGEWKLTADRTTLDLGKDRIISEKNVIFISPKAPPYKLEIHAQRLVADKIKGPTTILTATDSVTFNMLSMTNPLGAAKPVNTKAGYRIKGICEKAICEYTVKPNVKEPTVNLQMLTGKNVKGVDVQPNLEVVDLDTGKTITASGNSIVYNSETGECILDMSDIGSKEAK